MDCGWGPVCVEWVRKRVADSRADSGSATASACGRRRGSAGSSQLWRQHVAWPRLIAAAAATAAFTFTGGIRKLPTVFGRRAVSLQNVDGIEFIYRERLQNCERARNAAPCVAEDTAVFDVSSWPATPTDCPAAVGVGAGDDSDRRLVSITDWAPLPASNVSKVHVN